MINYLKNETFFYSYLFYLAVFVVILLVVFAIANFRNKKFKIKNLLFSKDNEEDLYNELEKNINEETKGLKNNLFQVKDELSKNMFNKDKDENDFISEQVKNISRKENLRNSKLADLKKNIIEIADVLQNNFTVNFSFFPNDDWSKVNNKIDDDLIYSIKKQLTYIGEYLKSNDIVNIQIIRHPDYINILFEVEKVFLEKNLFKKDDKLKEILDRRNGKYEINQFAEFGSIINTILPVQNKDSNTQLHEDKIRIILAEDHDVSLFGLMSLFKTRDDIEVVGMAKNGMEVLKILESKKADIIITDISMPGMDGIELSERIQAEYPEIKLIVFTMYLENWFIEQLINNGAMGFISKNSKIVELIGAVRNVYEGNKYYCPQFKSKYGFNGTKNSERKLDSLTRNELEIMKCYADNMNKHQIAEKILVSGKTIDTFVANILLKLNAGDEEEMVRIAKRQKYISE